MRNEFQIACIALWLCSAGATGAQRAAVDLPDAPSARSGSTGGAPARAGDGAITGVVLDINGGIVAGAKVTLEEMVAGAPLHVPGGTDGPKTVVVTSDTAGRFRFAGLAAARFRVTIAAVGLETFVSAEIVLKAGEARELPEIALPVASAKADVEVVVTQVELAQEQIAAEEKQRVFGVLPNFYTSYIWNAAPLTSGQKFRLAAKSATDPVEFVGAAAQAGGQYFYEVYPGYGYGVNGYFKRYAAAYGDGMFARMIGSGVLPSLLRQDPRYFYKGSGSKKSRVWYALTRAVVTRSDSGRAQPNYSHIGGAFLGGAISNAYHPAANRGIGLTITNGLIDTAGNAANNLIREFLLRDLTPSVPDYANGKQ